MSILLALLIAALCGVIAVWIGRYFVSERDARLAGLVVFLAVFLIRLGAF